MNEQDLILKQKIEKREKFDIILAYILIVVLLGLILLVLYLKFLRKEDMTKPEEYIPNYISLNEISYSLNNSTLTNLYLNNAANFSSSVSNNVLTVTYSKDDNNISLNIPQIGNELEFSLTEENNAISKDIYKEIASIICMYYGNSESNCRSTINSVTESNQTNGIRFVNGENNKYVYISIDKSIDTSIIPVYNTVTKTSIDNTNYTLNLEGLKIYDIKVEKTREEIKFNCTIERINNDNSNISIAAKLYDSNGDIKGENKYNFDEKNPLNNKADFTISFTFNEEDVNNIKSYSIEVIK